ncbi:MAG TPA: hypothetical protein VFB62_08585 [Polyangiaceae bacterium]|nr:hypothetical protein [Polyangiaceae bacterium]
MWRPAAIGILTLGCGCGGKTPLETCGAGGPVSFERPATDIPCKGSELFAIKNERDWQERCSQPITVDLSRSALIGYFLEDDCSYSGCVSQVPLITDIERSGCRLEVSTREVDPLELGACRACVQPHDFVLIDAALADGVLVSE